MIPILHVHTTRRLLVQLQGLLTMHLKQTGCSEVLVGDHCWLPIGIDSALTCAGFNPIIHHSRKAGRGSQHLATLTAEEVVIENGWNPPVFLPKQLNLQPSLGYKSISKMYFSGEMSASSGAARLVFASLSGRVWAPPPAAV